MNLIAFALTSVPLLIQLYSKLYRETDYSETLSELKGHAGLPKIDTYDFIIVGGGTAGCVLAGRLSSSFKVLLLETGGTPVPSTDSPFLTPQVGADTSINYFFTSTPQANAGQSNGGIIPVHTGKMLGGSGSHNDMVHSRGSPKDFDAIAQLTGDSSYSYASMIQHFKRSENFVGELVNPGEQDLYGKGGPLTLQTDMHASLPLWSAAGQELGYSYSDPNGYQREGFAPLQKLIDEKGRRVSTYNKYVQPYEDSRVNLTVLRYSTVSEILLDASNKAYGVAYKRHGIPQISHASKEIIVSGGTFGTPLLLMRSGIGPRNVLEEANIPVKVESPEVGRNLNDHAYAFLSPITFNASALPFITRLDGDLEFQEALNKYQNGEPSFFGEFQEGPQVILVSSRAQASPQEREWPDSRILFDWSCGGTLDASAPLQACMWGELDRPRSRGSVKLNATAYQEGVEDDEQLLVLDWKMFDDPSDMDVLIEALEFGLRLIETTKAFQGLAATYTAGPISPCTSFTFRSKAYWQCYTRHYAGSAIHMVGTCSIGKVVDSNLRVVGTTNLRIVDASVLPNTPNANLNAPVIAIAEKAATNILAQYAFTA